jgi:hypothetical protein
MDRKVVQDIVPSYRRSVTSIPIKKITSNRPMRISPPKKKRRIPSILITFIIVFVGIAIIAVALSLLYSKAVVTITPKIAHFDISGTFTAKKDSDTASSSLSSLSYQAIMSTDSITQTIPAVDGPLISTKSKGTITFYNEQSIQQKILAGTRISNPDGLIYRTSATVVIPAKKSGSVSPGTVTVVILADQAGAEYNMSLSGEAIFKVVAYKGGPKYTTIYGKLKTEILGGFSGNKKVISPEVRKVTTQSLKDTLATKLFDTAKSKVPKDSILYDKAYTIEYETPEPVSKDPQNAEVTVKGTFYGAAFKRTSFIKSIAAKALDKFPAPIYDIKGMDDLKFTLINTKDFSAKKGTPLIFTLKGPITLFATFSETALINELKGTHLKDSNLIFASYPAIANAYALITPFWMRSFPNSPNNIHIEIKE